MRVLTVTNMYPKQDAPYYGIFVKEQFEEVTRILGDENSKLHFIDGDSAVQKYFLSFFSLFRTIKSFSPDIIHLHFGLTILPLLVLLPWLKLKRIKLVLTTHGGDVVGHYPLTRLVTQVAIKVSDHIINVSNETNDIVKRKSLKSTYIPCGITKDFYSSKEERKPVVIFPSSPKRHEKNYGRFRKIINSVSKRVDVKFDIALLEGLTRKEVAALFRKSTVMLMTSNYEGSPQAVKEAILCDLPVVSTKVGDVSMLLENYAPCVVSDVDDELVDGIVHWLNNNEAFEYQERDKKALSNDVVCRQVVGIYHSLYL